MLRLTFDNIVTFRLVFKRVTLARVIVSVVDLCTVACLLLSALSLITFVKAFDWLGVSFVE